jgi:hypothetical protein
MSRPKLIAKNEPSRYAVNNKYKVLRSGSHKLPATIIPAVFANTTDGDGVNATLTKPERTAISRDARMTKIVIAPKALSKVDDFMPSAPEA